MKKNKLIVGTLIAAMIIGSAAYASIGSRTATLVYDNIKILLDSKEIIPTDANGNTVEPFIIDGTTYLPVRGISNSLGLNVEWNSATKTVVLTTPGAFSGAVQVYNDDNVTIEFAGCSAEKPYDWMDTVYYYANFNVKNKTDAELTFQTDALSFNGISYTGFIGSESVAAQSTGKVRFYTTQIALPTSGINKTSGTIRVIDFNETLLDMSYDAKWVNISK